MGEVFKGDFNPFGHYYEDTYEVLEPLRTASWFDIPVEIQPEPGTVSYIDYGHMNELMVKIEQELVPMLDQFLVVPNTTEVQKQIRDTVDGYFGTQWVAHMGHNIIVEVNPVNFGITVTAVVAYGEQDKVSTDFEISEKYRVDYAVNLSGMVDPEELRADTNSPTKEKESQSPDDILFEPIVVENEKKQPEPIYEDYGCYD